MPIPDQHPWRPGIDPETAAHRLRQERERLDIASNAIEEQQRLILHDGPQEVYLLSLDTLRSEQRKIQAEIAEIMRQREFEFIDFALDGPRYARHRANAKELSSFLHAVQKFYAHVKHGKLVRNAGYSIPPTLHARCQLDVEAFFPSSFGVRFVVYTDTVLGDGYSATNEALEAIFDLVATDNPLEAADCVTPSSMRQYRSLITALIKAGAAPKVQWISPEGKEHNWSADHNALITLQNRLAVLHHEEPRTLDATGILTGASLRRRRFEFSGQNLITGTTPKELEGKVTEYFGKPCRIVYSETLFFDEKTEQEKRSRMLLDITPA